MSASHVTDSDYPSLAWVSVPILLVPLGLFVRARLAARKLARTGIGRGAPGFQTGVRRIAVTPGIAARLRAGEQVSPEEIAAAQAQAATVSASGAGAAAEAGAALPSGSEAQGKKARKAASINDSEANEWLPEELRRAGKGEARSRKGKKKR
ncbi:hypothetical protein JB92DRAFT_2922712 [Gautieria morchelliformis]|nr:hypothetical protein JB92DRAFT_2922712 [Gautieria morchelliformis]